ncbi:nicotinate-nucleotide diphosphorylase, partial [Escherichia coli]|nr:nicotinate-nucleotide diphosphorylase [Escherichia coli]
MRHAVENASWLHPHTPVKDAVETLCALAEAMKARADIIMQSNFDPDLTRDTVKLIKAIKLFELFGNGTDQTRPAFAETGSGFH